MKFTSGIFAYIAVLIFAQVCSAQHNVLLPPNGVQCFFENLKKNDELAVTFQVGDRDPQSAQQLALDFWISDPNGKVVKKLQEVSHGDTSITAEKTGKYTYCFSNERSSIASKDVTFNIHGVVYVDLNDKNSDNLEVAIKKLTELTYDVKTEQSYIVVRERTHRNTAESTNSRVKWWSVFQLIVVALNSVFQVYYLKRFFEVRTPV